MQSNFTPEAEMAYAVDYEVRKLRIERGFDRYEISNHIYRDYVRDVMMVQLETELRGRRTESNTKAVDSVPYGLWAWVLYYLNRVLYVVTHNPAVLKYKTAAVRIETVETWNMCPHMGHSDLHHGQFMMYGPHLKERNSEAQVAAENIVRIACEAADATGMEVTMLKQRELFHHVWAYRKATGL